MKLWRFQIENKAEGIAENDVLNKDEKTDSAPAEEATAEKTVEQGDTAEIANTATVESVVPAADAPVTEEIIPPA